MYLLTKINKTTHLSYLCFHGYCNLISVSKYQISSYILDKVFKNGSSRICGRQPLKNLKGYGLPSFKKFEGVWSA